MGDLRNHFGYRTRELLDRYANEQLTSLGYGQDPDRSKHMQVKELSVLPKGQQPKS